MIVALSSVEALDEALPAAGTLATTIQQISCHSKGLTSLHDE